MIIKSKKIFYKDWVYTWLVEKNIMSKNQHMLIILILFLIT